MKEVLTKVTRLSALCLTVLLVLGANGCGTEPASESSPSPPAATTAPAQQPPAAQQPEQCAIKGNISYNSGEKIYHVPGQQYYDRTSIDASAGERYFCTEQEAIQAGWRKSKV